MQPEILRITVERIAEHARAHGLKSIQVILHGGEPLLAGPVYLADAADLIRCTLAAVGTAVELSIQSNGLLLDDHFLRVFHEHDVKVGISLDGDPATHDRHRLRPDGRTSYDRGSPDRGSPDRGSPDRGSPDRGSPDRGSHDQVSRAVRLLSQPEHRPLFAGLLGVVDLAADPIAYYQAMLACHPPMIDLLLPHGTWDTLPPGLDPHGRETPYGDWLVAVFDHWYDAPRRETGIRFFEAVISLIVGGDTACESLGTGQVDLLTVETDGSIEQVDSLKVAAEGAPATGLHVARDSFDAALRHPGIAARQRGLDALSDTCRACPIVTICGGGLYTHRYRARDGFGNPSVYCHDLYRLITHAIDRVRHDLERLPSSVGSARTAGSDDQRLLDVTVQPLPVADHQAVGVPLAENTDDLAQDLCP